MTPRRIAVLLGGRSSEHEVSLASGASVAAGLREAGHAVTEILIGCDGIWRTGDEIVRVGLGEPLRDIDVVFPVLHGPFGEDGTVQGLLECLDMPYVGAGILASALCMDKIAFKQVMAAAGIPQVGWVGLVEAEHAADPDRSRRQVEPLGYPVFVKPARLGSSVGIARVADPEELPAALEQAFDHDSLVIVEALAGGIEVECSVIGNADPLVSPPGEILLAGGEGAWYDYEAKYTPGGMQLIVPARISPTARERVRALAARTYTTAGCTGLARADFFVDGETVIVNELNTMPGFTPTSVFGSLFAADGIPYPELLDRLVELAVARYEDGRRHRH